MRTPKYVQVVRRMRRADCSQLQRLATHPAFGNLSHSPLFGAMNERFGVCKTPFE
jgi:hypothetical protein